MWRVLAFQHRGLASITCFAQFGIELNRPQESYAELLGGSFRSSTRKDIDFVIAMRANEVAHVLDDTHQIDFHLPKHFDGFAPVLQRHVGGSRYHNCSGKRDGLHQRQGYVARARRKIDYQVVELPPLHGVQELANDLVQHGAAPDYGLVAGIEKAYGNDLQPMRQDRLDTLVADRFRLRIRSEHQGDIWAVDVRVQQSYFVA